MDLYFQGMGWYHKGACPENMEQACGFTNALWRSIREISSGSTQTARTLRDSPFRSRKNRRR
jgi:hypothetical protein